MRLCTAYFEIIVGTKHKKLNKPGQDGENTMPSDITTGILDFILYDYYFILNNADLARVTRALKLCKIDFS